MGLPITGQDVFSRLPIKNGTNHSVGWSSPCTKRMAKNAYTFVQSTASVPTSTFIAQPKSNTGLRPILCDREVEECVEKCVPNLFAAHPDTNAPMNAPMYINDCTTALSQARSQTSPHCEDTKNINTVFLLD